MKFNLKANKLFATGFLPCRHCKRKLPLSAMRQDKSCKLGYRTVCKECSVRKNKETNFNHNCAVSCDNILKKCLKCTNEYPKPFFRIAKRKTDSHHDWCNVCCYKESADKRKIQWLLTNEQAFKLMKEICSYCGFISTFNGIDRFENTKGYDLENSRSCCSQCNYAKRDQSPEQWQEWIDRITKFTRSSQAFYSHHVFPTERNHQRAQ